MNRIPIDELNGKHGFLEWLSILTNIGIQFNAIFKAMTIDAIVAGAGIWGCTVARRHDGPGHRHPQATHGRRAARNPAPAAGSRLLWADTI